MDETPFSFATPFGNDVDPRRFIEIAVHAEALARLFYLVEQGHPFGLLLGPSGTGKSIVLRVLADRLARSTSRPVFVDACGLAADELTWELSAALRLAPLPAEQPQRLFRAIADSLRGDRSAHPAYVLIFDHVDAGDRQCTALLQRLLHLAPTNTTVIAACANGARACGPFSWLIERSDLRIETRAFDRHDVESFVRSVLEQRGDAAACFTEDAFESLFQHTRGVPREINRLCNLAVLVARSNGETLIEEAHIDAAVAETIGVSSSVGEVPVLVSVP